MRPLASKLSQQIQSFFNKFIFFQNSENDFFNVKIIVSNDSMVDVGQA